MKASIQSDFYCECEKPMQRHIAESATGPLVVYLCTNEACPHYRVMYLPPKVEMEKFDA